jgi:hypothetical protein
MRPQPRELREPDGVVLGLSHLHRGRSLHGYAPGFQQQNLVGDDDWDQPVLDRIQPHLPVRPSRSRRGFFGDARRSRTFLASPHERSDAVGAQLYRVGAPFAAGALAIPIEPIPGLDTLYDIGVPIALLWYWFTFFKGAAWTGPTMRSGLAALRIGSRAACIKVFPNGGAARISETASRRSRLWDRLGGAPPDPLSPSTQGLLTAARVRILMMGKNSDFARLSQHAAR